MERPVTLNVNLDQAAAQAACLPASLPLCPCPDLTVSEMQKICGREGAGRHIGFTLSHLVLLNALAKTRWNIKNAFRICFNLR